MRKYLPTLGELIDRLSIIQLKEVKIPQHKEEYAQEIKDIVHDISAILSTTKKLKISYMISIRYYWMRNLVEISLMVI